MKFVDIFHTGIDSNLDIDLTFLSIVVLKLSPSLESPMSYLLLYILHNIILDQITNFHVREMITITMKFTDLTMNPNIQKHLAL